MNGCRKGRTVKLGPWIGLCACTKTNQRNNRDLHNYGHVSKPYAPQRRRANRRNQKLRIGIRATDADAANGNWEENKYGQRNADGLSTQSGMSFQTWCMRWCALG